MRQPIKRRVERILQAPYHNTETLADIDVQKKIRVKKPGFWQKPGFSTPNDYLTVYSSRGVNLVGCRSARVDRNFRIIFVICEECRQILACEYCQCDDLADQTVVFLTVGPHDRAYTME